MGIYDFLISRGEGGKGEEGERERKKGKMLGDGGT